MYFPLLLLGVKPGVKRKSMSHGDEVDLEVLQQLKDIVKPVDQEDQYELSVVATLRSMPAEQRALATLRIQNTASAL